MSEICAPPFEPKFCKLPNFALLVRSVRDRAPSPFYRMLGQTYVNGWSRVVASQNGGSISYIFPFRLRVL